VALGAFVQLGLDELPHRPVEQLLAQALSASSGPNGFGRRTETAFPEGGADRDVLFPQPQALLHRARGMADLQPQVPQHVERASMTLSMAGVIFHGVTNRRSTSE
jgi:hypothetical protein